MSVFDAQTLLTPKVFIGSSSTQDATDVAVLLQEDLQQHAIEAEVWSQDLFEVGHQTFSELVHILRRYDFGVMVFWPDDDLRLGETTYKSTRDNVILELGMFLGALGPDRAFILRNKNTTRWLSDLAGVTAADFTPRDNLKAAASPAIKKIRDRIRRSRPTCIREFEFASVGDAHAYIKALLRTDSINTVRQVSLSNQPYVGTRSLDQFSTDIAEFLAKDENRYCYVYNPEVASRTERVRKLLQTGAVGLSVRQLAGHFPDDLQNFIIFDDREVIVITPRRDLPNQMRLFRRPELLGLYEAQFSALFASGAPPSYWPPPKDAD